MLTSVEPILKPPVTLQCVTTSRQLPEHRISMITCDHLYPQYAWCVEHVASLPDFAREKMNFLQDRNSKLSPIIWTGCKRITGCFESGSFVGIDFDNGEPTLTQALTEFSGFRGFIHTTRSHQIWKKKRKSKEPACDRYRVFIPLDGAVNNPLDWKIIQYALLRLWPTACHGNIDEIRFFYAAENCRIYPLDGELALSTERLLKLAETLGIEPCLYDKPGISLNGQNGETSQPSISLNLQGGELDMNLLATLEKRKAEQDSDPKWSDSTTHSRIHSLLVHAFDKCPSPANVYQTFLEWDYVDEWFQRREDRPKQFKRKVEDAYTFWAELQMLKHGYQPLEPAIETSLVAAEELPSPTPHHMTGIKQYEKKHRVPQNERTKATHKLFKHLMEKQHHSVLDAPCGVGKTTAARCYIATMANPERRFWLVKGTLRDCQEETRILSKMKVNTGFVCGFHDSICKVGHSLNSWKSMYRQSTTPCKKCKSAQNCPFYKTLFHEQDELSHPVVVMTHERLVRYIETNQVPTDVDIIIDEAIDRFATFCLTESVRQSVLEAVPSEASPSLHKFFMQLNKFVADRGCHQVKGVHRVKTVLDKLPDTLSHAAGHSLDTLESVWAFVNFFRHTSGKMMAVEDKATKGILLRKQRVDLNVPNRVVILDGSARFSPTCLPTFKAFRAVEHEPPDYTNTTLHILPFSPTKTRLKALAPQILETTENLLKTVKNPRPFIILNKNHTQSKKLIPEFETLNGVQLTRGQALGSNAASRCNVGILATSLFTTASDYILRAAVATDSDIETERIWNNNWLRFSDGKFDDADIDIQFRRQCVDELYQYIMRGVIRRDPNAKYDVLVMISNWHILHELTQLLPGAAIKLIDTSTSRTAKWIKTYHLIHASRANHTSSFRKLCKKLNIPNNGNNMDQLKVQIAFISYGKARRDTS